MSVDLADVWRGADRKQLIRTLAWGDFVTVTARTAAHLEVELVDFVSQRDGSVLPRKTVGVMKPSGSSGLKAKELVRPVAENDVVKVNFVDVQQGDGAVIETPDGQVILVDGGDNQMFARYLAGRYRGTSLEAPKEVSCILVTHGDADHFDGLTQIHASETNREPRKRLFLRPRRVYHNGIVKGPSSRGGKRVKDEELLGATTAKGGELYVTGLVEDLLAVPDAEMNQPFKAWKRALKAYAARDPQPIEFRRLQKGDSGAFAFFNTADRRIEVLGPLVEDVGGKPGVKFLGDPPHGPRIGHESLSTEALKATGKSASHTINGHSVVFRLVCGGFSYLFSGDLNDEASRVLAKEHDDGAIDVRSTVFKVPHHGSGDFSGGFIQRVSPVVSVVSCGDESARKEFIHPRATIMGALGRLSRVAEPLVLVTELVAFFQVEGWSKLSKPETAEQKKRGEFFGFSRAAYGIVKTRTDGKRLFVYTDSANVRLKEAYAYTLDAAGEPVPAKVRRG